MKNIFSSRNLQEGVDEVYKELKDPVERSETRDVDVDVTDVADGKVRQLESAPIGDVHLDNICLGIFPKWQEAKISCKLYGISSSLFPPTSASM